MDDNKKLSEGQLQDVSGGGPQLSNPSDLKKEGKCYFTPDNSENIKYEYGYHWKRCASTCFGCFCHGKDWCVNRWHHVTADGELIPSGRSNHTAKPKSNNYNT